MNKKTLVPLLSVRDSAALAKRYGSASELLTAARLRAHEASGLERIKNAMDVLEALLLAAASEHSVCLNTPATVRDFLKVHFAGCADEKFCVLYLNSQNRLLACIDEFFGSLSQTAVYPRVIVRRALGLNAGAVIFAHQHPSGIAEPSHADRTLTEALRGALAHIEVRVLDHFIVGGANLYSFAERGEL